MKTNTENSGIALRSLRRGLAAAYQNRWAAVILWIFGAILILTYYFVPPARQGFDWIGSIKTHWGWIFSCLSTAIFGGLIPGLISGVCGIKDARGRALGAAYLVSNMIIWGLKGIEIDFWYRFQAMMIGDEATTAIIFLKTFVDQLVYVPIFGMVNVVLVYHWRDCGYSWTRFRRTLGKHWYRERVLPALISNWVVWIPAVVLIYCLPLSLQLPVQNLILCFWVLVLSILTGDPKTEPQEMENGMIGENVQLSNAESKI